jgi:hypothetical protein
MMIHRSVLTVSRTIHVYLSLALLLMLVFFAITGITLNNPAQFSGDAEVENVTLTQLPALPRNEDNQIVASPQLANFVREQFGIRLALATISYEEEFLIVDYQAPGHATVLEIDQESNEALAEHTDYGLIATLNDLHKGRHADVIWSWLIDISGVLTVLFSVAGLILLLPNQRRLQRVLLYSAVGCVMLGGGYYLGNL